MPLIMRYTPALIALLGLALPLGACASQEETAAEPTAETPAAELTPEQEAADEAEEQALSEFAETAWRVTAEDGARYVTYIDPDGTYRDLRNGNLWQQGSWTFDKAPDDGGDSDLLCFTPDAEDARERCWEPGRLQDNELVVTSGGARRVSLEKVTYEAPEDATPEE